MIIGQVIRQQTPAMLRVEDDDMLEDVTASPATHPLHGGMLPQPCRAIVCPHRRMLYFGHP